MDVNIFQELQIAIISHYIFSISDSDLKFFTNSFFDWRHVWGHTVLLGTLRNGGGTFMNKQWWRDLEKALCTMWNEI